MSGEDNTAINILAQQVLQQNQLLSALKEELGKTGQHLKDLNSRLLGNGQPGEIQKFQLALTEHADTDRKCFDALKEEIRKLRLWQFGKARWISAVVSILVAEGGIIAFFIKYHKEIVGVFGH